MAAPAAAPASSPGAASPPGLEVLHINFEIKNFNYYDLTKETCPKKVKVPKKKPSAPAPKAAPKKGPLDPLGDLDKHLGTIKAKDADQDLDKAVEDIHSSSSDISKQVESGLDDFGSALNLPKLPYMAKENKAASLLQLGACAPMPDLTLASSPNKCSTVMDVLRDAIKETVLGVIRCLYQKSLLEPMAPGPAPAPSALPVLTLPGAPAGVSGLIPLPAQLPKESGFLSPGPAPAMGPAPSPGGAMPPFPDVKVFVTFSPGREMEGGRSTLVEVAFLDTPLNGIDDVAIAMPLIQASIDSGLFHAQVKAALHAVTGIKPKLHKIEMSMKVIEQIDLNKCEEHIRGIVNQFSLHYTRNQVPMALYNECTNFMTRMSFSHDYVLDPLDTIRCRKTTAKFAKHWDYGEKAEDSDFSDMCHQACEAKYGRGAPKCNLHEGEGLMMQPKL